MRKTIIGKRTAALLFVLFIAVSSCCATAEESTVERLLRVPDFKFYHKGSGIGGNAQWPVYTAPSGEALRLADGNAWCNPRGELSIGGFTENDWLMVRYRTTEGYSRVGYVPPESTKGYRIRAEGLEFDSVQVTAADDITITDDLDEHLGPFGTIEAGKTFTILAKYTYYGNWWYVETTVDGKTARGFIHRGTAPIEADGKFYRGNAELGYPACSPMETGMIGIVTVHATTANRVNRKPDASSAMVARVFDGDQFPCYGMGKGYKDKVWYYVWVDGVWGWISSGIAELAEGEQ